MWFSSRQVHTRGDVKAHPAIQPKVTSVYDCVSSLRHCSRKHYIIMTRLRQSYELGTSGRQQHSNVGMFIPVQYCPSNNFPSFSQDEQRTAYELTDVRFVHLSLQKWYPIVTNALEKIFFKNHTLIVSPILGKNTVSKVGNNIREIDIEKFTKFCLIYYFSGQIYRLSMKSYTYIFSSLRKVVFSCEYNICLKQ